ncbi:MAG: TldD/PmbA family protein [Actinomycetia bacterium]|nr:TldD/PmbA family protein [Actinomycetes bacterium]MCP5031658.1 TldD/PmbA family protein [Actinomycetes bacterium]
MADQVANTISQLEGRLGAALPLDVDYASVRFSEERGEYLSVRRGVVEPVTTNLDAGVMVTVWAGGGHGYAATSDLTVEGLAAAVTRAKDWATRTAGRSMVENPPFEHPVGFYQSPVEQSWDDTTLVDRIDLLRHADSKLNTNDRIVDWSAAMGRIDTDSLILTSGGGRIEQRTRNTYPLMHVTANEGSNTQTRSYGRGSFVGQGGREVLSRHHFDQAADRLPIEVLQLLDADNCPTATMDVVLAPDQMILQIHESIGHPLELDRILGDERNYAGTSFVTPEMFGTYQYGSNLLNVTYDPTVEGQLASYGFDDEGSKAERQYLIRNGLLERPLGGALSQARAGMEGVANSRSCSWNRAPIDRMANLNVEPGESSFEDLIAGVERGLYLQTNNSWSIDDSRNKFQFSCEYGQLIEDGELTAVVRNPSYRGISATFWRSLSGVADEESFTVMGTPNCGKGEPNQQVGTGHASPACRFSAIEVFGGES